MSDIKIEVTSLNWKGLIAMGFYLGLGFFASGITAYQVFVFAMKGLYH